MFKKIFKPLGPIKTRSIKRTLITAYNERCFWVHNGPILSNLKDLHRALEGMTDKQFSFHVSSKKNDFSSWVELVLLDRECAASLKKNPSRKKSALVVKEALKKYSS